MKWFTRKHLLLVLALMFVVVITCLLYLENSKRSRLPIPIQEILSSDENLVGVDIGGGLCSNGPCFSQYFIKKNGEFLNGKHRITTIDKNDLISLENEINKTNFEQVKSKSFNGMCPSAYDGPAFTYYIYTEKSVESIGSCQYDISDVRLFNLIAEIRNKYQNL